MVQFPLKDILSIFYSSLLVHCQVFEALHAYSVPHLVSQNSQFVMNTPQFHWRQTRSECSFFVGFGLHSNWQQSKTSALHHNQIFLSLTTRPARGTQIPFRRHVLWGWTNVDIFARKVTWTLGRYLPMSLDLLMRAVLLSSIGRWTAWNTHWLSGVVNVSGSQNQFPKLTNTLTILLDHFVMFVMTRCSTY
jgi:hypothetical protein